MNYISLFSSAGVGCYGFKQEKYKCIATVELLERRMNIQINNNKCSRKSGYICGDITKQDTHDKIITEARREKSIDVIIATPPCQGMSLANHKKNENDKKKNSLVVESIKLILEIMPKYFILENVRSFLTTICTDIYGEDKQIGIMIDDMLAEKYNIEKKKINFKDYGSNSSRTRTLVIGVLKDLAILPNKLFPEKKESKTLKDVIGHLESINEMGEISFADIYHSFRSYDSRMLPWIENTKYGDTAFNNKNKEHVPHRIINGKYVENKSKNGNKYQRQKWENVAPCIHTRNDILASQNTVHPIDNRVFSIRELMLMMNIPKTFKWSNVKESELNNLTLEKKREYLKKNDVNIRQSIGEAVPTNIMKEIASKIRRFEENAK